MKYTPMTKPRIQKLQNHPGWICLGPHPWCGLINGVGGTAAEAYWDYWSLIGSFQADQWRFNQATREIENA